MAMRYVKIYFGQCGMPPVHRPQRLAGLRNRLRRLGYRVDLEPIDAHEYCALEMCGYLVFRCNIKHLQFNLTWKRDPVALRAIACVMDATESFKRARAQLWTWQIIEEAMFKRNEFSSTDYFVTEDLPDFKLECKDCICRRDELVMLGKCTCNLEKCDCGEKDCKCKLETCDCEEVAVKNKCTCMPSVRYCACGDENCKCALDTCVCPEQGMIGAENKCIDQVIFIAQKNSDTDTVGEVDVDEGTLLIEKSRSIHFE